MQAALSHPAGPSAAQLGLVARYQVATLALAWGLARLLRPEAAGSLLEGGILVALNLQLSRLALPLIARLRAMPGSPGRRLAAVAGTSLAKLLVQLGLAAGLLLTWSPLGPPFLLGLLTFLGGTTGALLHGLVGAGRGRGAAVRPGAG